MVISKQKEKKVIKYIQNIWTRPEKSKAAFSGVKNVQTILRLDHNLNIPSYLIRKALNQLPGMSNEIIVPLQTKKTYFIAYQSGITSGKIKNPRSFSAGGVGYTWACDLGFAPKWKKFTCFLVSTLFLPGRVLQWSLLFFKNWAANCPIAKFLLHRWLWTSPPDT